MGINAGLDQLQLEALARLSLQMLSVADLVSKAGGMLIMVCSRRALSNLRVQLIDEHLIGIKICLLIFDSS